jgi:L-fucose mutarotase
MLKGIDPVLRGELLKALEEMGHGERLALVDQNFPAYGVGAPVIDLGEVSAARATQAIMSVFPLDPFVETPLERMGIDDDLAGSNDCHDAVLDIARSSASESWPWSVIPRHDFYREVKNVALVVRCLESAPYACFMFRKGVL